MPKIPLLKGGINPKVFPGFTRCLIWLGAGLNGVSKTKGEERVNWGALI